ncbi:MAG: hypothetical protein AAGI89_05020 [Pseudomonadota bacterium]
MTTIDRFRTAAIAATIPFLGTIALTQVGIFQIMAASGSAAAEGGNGFEAFDPALADFVPFMSVLYMLSAIPVIVLVLSPSARTKWSAITVSGLLLLAHAAHILEHIAGADYWGSLLIIVTAVVPYSVVIAKLRGAQINEAEAS